jgi:hypothetical protein
MRRDFRSYLKYAKKQLALAEDAIDKHENAECFLIPSVVLAWSAIELFVNNRCGDLNSLPEDMFETHEKAFLLEKRLRFENKGASIGKFILEGTEYQTLENKMFFLLSKLGTRDATKLKGGTLWGRFEEFKDLRDSLVHPRHEKQAELTPDKVRQNIETATELIQEISQRIWKKKIDI